MIKDMGLPEVTQCEAREWDSKAALPAMREIVQHCEHADIKNQRVDVVVHWYVFLSQHDATTLETFLQKFSEAEERKDFHGFSQYCFKLYRNILQKKLAAETNSLAKNFFQKRIEDFIKMEQLGDRFHKDTQNKYWQENAYIATPDKGELPGEYRRILDNYDSIKDFLAEHPETRAENSSAQISASRNGIAQEVHEVLKT